MRAKWTNKSRRTFWGFVKNIFKKTASTLPSFDGAACTTFFAKTFNSINPFKSFEMPDWIPSLSAPTVKFDLSPPSYKQITKVVRKIKASGSPCPLDQISIIPFKRYTYLRSYLTEVFRIIWLTGEIPDVWKKACSVLVHKKVTSPTLLTLGLLLWNVLLSKSLRHACVTPCLHFYPLTGILVGHTERPHWEMVFTLCRQLVLDQNLMLKTMVPTDF